MYYKNINVLVVILVACIGFPYSNWAQIEVKSGDSQPYTPINIIENVFLGSGLEVNDIQFYGSDRAVGVFSNGSSFIGLEHGIVLSTGYATTAEESNDPTTNAKGPTSNNSISDFLLQSIAGSGSDILDIARYEITFVPESDNISFKYVFASEEYDEFVCSSFNDVFGFFISGPNPDGGDYNDVNIARVPDPADTSGNTYVNYNVAINSVNSGEMGTLGIIDLDNCSGANGSLDYSQYYNKVGDNQFPVYDAYLDVFIAQAAVVPCQEYTIKLAIGDVEDQDFDSAVFLEAASFYSPSLDYLITTDSPDCAIAEGCTPVEIDVEIPFPLNIDREVEIAPLSEGQFSDQARNNVDYVMPADKIIIPAGQTSVSFMIEALEDNNPELDEYIYLDFQRSVCKRDTLKIKIVENKLTQVMLPGDTSICANDLLRLTPEYDPPVVEYEPRVFTNNTLLVMGESNEMYPSFISVSGLAEDKLTRSIFTKVCLDSLASRDMTDVELYLVAPQGQILELSSHNGLRAKPAFCNMNPNASGCIDTLMNTCFTLDAGVNINNGNALIGPVFPGDDKGNYMGDYLPEGDWSEIFTNDASANGTWQLLVKSDSVSVEDVSGQNSFLNGWSIHFEAQYEVNHFWSPNFELGCQECDITFVNPSDDVTYKLDVTDSYGCTSFEEIRITVLPVTIPPEIISCDTLSPSSIQITWTDVGIDVETYQVNQNSSSEFFETTENTFVFEGLEAGAEHLFSVSAFNGQCYTALDTLTCPTPPCTNFAPTVDMVSAFPPSCPGRNDGQIFAQASTQDGGELTYFIENSSNSTGEFNSLTEGGYELRVVNEFGCSTIDSVFVPAAQELEFELAGSGITCVGMSDAIAIIEIPDMVNPPYTILWQNSSEEFTQVDLGMGTYFFTITDGVGCNYENNIVIRDPEPLTFESIDSQLPVCYGDEGSIQLTMNGGTMPYNYEWEDSTDNTSLVSFFPGNYSVTVSDANGCSIFTSIEIEDRLEINVLQDSLQAACIGELSQEIELEIDGGAPPFTVQWGSTISGVEVEDIPVGFYELTITDSNGCIVIDSIEILNYPDLVVEFDLRDPDCFNIANGIISVRSTIYTDGTMLQDDDKIIWEGGSTDVARGNLLGDSTYQYTITDDFGCKHIDAVYLPSPPVIYANVDTIKLLECFGDEDGSFLVGPTGGTGELTISWSSNTGNVQNNTASDLSAGLYLVTITDEDGCFIVEEFNMIEPAELNYNSEIHDVDCFEETSGEIVGEVTGGVGPYDLMWSNGSSNDSLFNLESGVYELTILDANGCSFSDNYEISQPDEPLVVEYEAFDTECYKTSTGSLALFISGGTGPYNVLLDSVNYFDNTLITGLAAGTYDLLVIDDNGCENITFDLLIEEAPEVFVTLPSDTMVEFGSSITLEFMTNSDILVDYSWTSSSPEAVLSCEDCANPIIDPVIVDFFVTLTARDSSGCKYTTAEYYISESDDGFVEVPTGFSPNGDNRNDKLYVFGSDNVEVMNFEIFDRWGELIHSDVDFFTNDFTHFWDGTFMGKEMDSGVYVWKIQIKRVNGEIEFKEGNVTLLR